MYQRIAPDPKQQEPQQPFLPQSAQREVPLPRANLARRHRLSLSLHTAAVRLWDVFGNVEIAFETGVDACA
jgi:hypothetical protein